MDPWEFVKTGRFREAVDAYSGQIEERPEPFPYFNRGMAYLNLDELEKAEADFLRADELDRQSPYSRRFKHRSDSYLKMVGVAQWLGDRREEAALTWRSLVQDHQANRISYSDASGGAGSGLLLWFAGTVVGAQEDVDAAIAWLQKNLSQEKRSGWPRPVAKFVLGQIPSQELLAIAKEVPSLAARHSCNAEFYVGTSRLSSDPPSARRSYERCVDQRAYLEEEFYLAAHELRRLPRASS